MQLRKIATIGITLALACSPLLVKASDLTITNNTKNSFTAVLVTSNPLHPCSGTVPLFPDFTSPGEQNHLVPWNNVKFLCAGSKSGICTADVYVTKNCAPGSKVATASMNLNTTAVSILGNDNPSKFVVTANGSHVDINQVG